MPRMVAFFGFGCSIALAGATCEQENALSLVQMTAQKWGIRVKATGEDEEEQQFGEMTPHQGGSKMLADAAHVGLRFAPDAATGEEEEEALQQQRTGADLDASVIASASHWGSPGTCKVTDDTFFSVFDGANVNMSLLQADIDTDTDTDTNTDSGFRLKDFLKDGEAKDLWLVRGRAHDGSTVRIAARYWRNASSTGHQVFLKSLAVSGGFMTNRTLVVRPLQDDITWNNKKESYPILMKEESAFSIEGLVNATRTKKTSSSVSTVEVQLPKEMKLLITRHQKYVNIAITMPPLAIQDGLCGNFNGDSSDDTLGLILSRGPGVKEEHSLFPAEWVPPHQAAPAELDGEMFTESRNDVVLDMD